MIAIVSYFDKILNLLLSKIRYTLKLYSLFKYLNINLNLINFTIRAVGG